MVKQLFLNGIGSEGLPYYSREELQQSPSLKDGLEPYREAQFRTQYTYFISEVGRNLQVPQWAIYTAIYLCNHYFAKRSMKRNDRYLVATACLYLSCKVQESPKYLRDVIKEAERKKWEQYAREHPAELRKWDDVPHLETMRDQVLVAERAVLYTVSFQLRIKVPYPDLIQLHNSLTQEGPHKQDVFNIAWSCLNDSVHTTLSLQYPPEKLAGAALYLAHQVVGAPLPHKDGHDFCKLANISQYELKDIADQMLEVYVTVAASDSRGAAPATPSQQRGFGQPSSPDDSHLQLLGNKIALAMPIADHHQQQAEQQPPYRVTPSTPPQLPQQQQQPPLANGTQQHSGPG